LGVAIAEASGLSFLFTSDEFWTRSLDVRVTARERRTAPDGSAYLQLTLVLDDPFVGEIEALHLLPADREGPFATVLVLPGHGDDAVQHRDGRFGWVFPSQGMAALILTFRGYQQPVDHTMTTEFLCQGFSLMSLRAYEALVAEKYLLATDLACNSALGILGHSGGSIAANLLTWMEQNPARAQVSDGTTDYWNVLKHPSGLVELDCETHEGLWQLGERINDLAAAPRPTKLVPYAYAKCEDCPEPSARDVAATDRFLPFFREQLGTSAP
jgi:hypothetical protein